MKLIPTNIMIDEIIALLNHEQPKLCEWYFRTLIEKLKFIPPSLLLQEQCDAALGIMKGMLLSITEEKENEGLPLKADADYTIEQIQSFAENLFHTRFDMHHIIHPWILRQFCEMNLKGTVPTRDFDYAMLNSFNIARNCVKLVDAHVNHLQEIYNKYRGKPYDAMIFYHRKRDLAKISYQLNKIYNNPQITLVTKLAAADVIFMKHAESDNTRSVFKQFCHDKSQEIAFMHGALVQDIATNPFTATLFDEEVQQPEITIPTRKRDRYKR